MRMSSWLTLSVAVVLSACSAEGNGPISPETGGLAATGHANGAVLESASGGGRMVLEVFGFTIPQVLGFHAAKLADGSVSGDINYRQTFEGETFHFVATVTCLNVYDGNRAKYGGQITRSTDPTVPVGDFMWFQSIDNGEGESSPPDRSTGSGFGTEAENEAFCASADLPNPIFLADVIGNIQVHD